MKKILAGIFLCLMNSVSTTNTFDLEIANKTKYYVFEVEKIETPKAGTSGGCLEFNQKSNIEPGQTRTFKIEDNCFVSHLKINPTPELIEGDFIKQWEDRISAETAMPKGADNPQLKRFEIVQETDSRSGRYRFKIRPVISREARSVARGKK